MLYDNPEDNHHFDGTEAAGPYRTKHNLGTTVDIQRSSGIHTYVVCSAHNTTFTPSIIVL